MRIILFSLPCGLCIMGIHCVIVSEKPVLGRIVFLFLFGVILIVSAAFMTGFTHIFIERIIHG